MLRHILYLCLIMAAGPAPAQNPALPRAIYACFKTAAPPAIDGRLDDPCWQQAESITNLVTCDQGLAATHPVEVKLAWDDTHIYLAFHCEDDDIRCAVTKRDEIKLCSEEFAEVMFDADQSGDRYLEYAVSPTGLHVDYYLYFLKNDPAAKKWDAAWETTGVRHAVLVAGTVNQPADRDRYWNLEIAMPYAKNILDAPNLPPREGDTWRMNLFRLDKHGGLKADEWLAWQPTGAIDFNRPQFFGLLKFRPGNP